jgi:hypothetical protein
MPVPSRRFKPKMVLFCKMIEKQTKKTNREEASPNKNMKTMKTCCHKKATTKNPIKNRKIGRHTK